MIFGKVWVVVVVVVVVVFVMRWMVLIRGGIGEERMVLVGAIMLVVAVIIVGEWYGRWAEVGGFCNCCRWVGVEGLRMGFLRVLCSLVALMVGVVVLVVVPAFEGSVYRRRSREDSEGASGTQCLL